MSTLADRPAPATTDVIRTEGLTKHFPLKRSARHEGDGPNIRAVDGVTLAIPPGATLGLVGESGSGKSTIARLVLRLMPPTDGRVFFEGNDITDAKGGELRALRHRMQLVFQDPYSSFDPQATVLDSVIEPLRAQGHGRGPCERRATQLFDLVGLAREHLQRYPRELSGGQLQRAGIARALATDPRLVVMDEPVSALDVSTQAQVINLLEDLQNELGIAFLFIAHDLAVVRHVSDRIAVMYLGQIVEEGPAEELYNAPTHPYTHALVSAIPVPNPRVQRGRPRVVLRGEIPSPANPPSGCRFRTRCPFVMPICAEDPPEFVTPAGIRTFCHLHTSGPVIAGAPISTLPVPPSENVADPPASN
jgi:oligopeptide/dipeptide ABC transporter ATP-binding protein